MSPTPSLVSEATNASSSLHTTDNKKKKTGSLLPLTDGGIPYWQFPDDAYLDMYRERRKALRNAQPSATEKVRNPLAGGELGKLLLRNLKAELAIVKKFSTKIWNHARGKRGVLYERFRRNMKEVDIAFAREDLDYRLESMSMDKLTAEELQIANEESALGSEWHVLSLQGALLDVECKNIDEELPRRHSARSTAYQAWLHVETLVDRLEQLDDEFLKQYYILENEKFEIDQAEDKQGKEKSAEEASRVEAERRDIRLRYSILNSGREELEEILERRRGESDDAYLLLLRAEKQWERLERKLDGWERREEEFMKRKREYEERCAALERAKCKYAKGMSRRSRWHRGFGGS